MKKFGCLVGLLVFIGALYAVPASAGEVILLIDRDLDSITAGNTQIETGTYVDPDQIDIDNSNLAVANNGSHAAVEDRGVLIDVEAQMELEAIQNQNVSSGGDVGQALVRDDALMEADGQIVQVTAGSETKSGVNVATGLVGTAGNGSLYITQYVVDPVTVATDDIGTLICADSIDDSDMVDVDQTNGAFANNGSTARVEDRPIVLTDEAQEELVADQNQNVSSAGDKFCKGDVGQAEMRDQAAQMATAQVIQVLAGSNSIIGLNVASGEVLNCAEGFLNIYQSVTLN